MTTRTLPLQTRLARIERAAESDTIEVVWSTGAEVRRYDWWRDEEFVEELDLSGADLTRLNGGAPVLANHNTYSLNSVIGVVERAWIDGNEGRAEIRFSDRPDVAGIRADVASGILRNLSIGYQINEIKRECGAPGEPDRVRVTRFQPYEISLVTVPADAKAQIQRDGIQPEYPVIVHEEPLMSDHADAGPDTPAPTLDAPETPTPETAPADIDALVAERVQRELSAVREREKAIRELCQSVRMADLADSLIDANASLEQAKDAVIRRLVEAGGPEIRQMTTAHAPTVNHAAVAAAQQRLFNQVAGRV